MRLASVIRIEKTVERLASALFALACGYATNLWFAGQLQKPVLGAATLAATVFAYFLGSRALGAVPPELPRRPVPIFDVRQVEPMDCGDLLPAPAEIADPSELLLTDRVKKDGATSEEPLLLDDVLAGPSFDSRVVRLFDPAAMPATGGPGSRFDRHFEGEASAAQSHDAAQALHEALAELRRSLR